MKSILTIIYIISILNIIYILLNYFILLS